MEKLTPEIFNLAFSYRDFGNECDHFEYNWQKATYSENQNILDVACGTGGHIEQFCSRGYTCCGIDYDKDMVAFCNNRFKNSPYAVSFEHRNLISFKLKNKYGLALNLLNTANDILENQDFVEHLKSVANALDTGGIYILEMAHPKELNQQGQVPTRTWEINRDSNIINAELRYSQERFDPINQSRDCTLRVSVQNGDSEHVYVDTRKNRIYLFQEFLALVELSGCFELVTCYGTFNSAVALNDERRAVRMIPVLRKTV